ncbi:GNAT family N-acetyltransferase [Nocardiopsis eucommiae]|uniref:GNAT family N-acetyltransferase n=1 Tax=Nocardiopsis eucommiae TaxID=2831970 RepID=A0A975L730_9ACTN|nr:GNAT family N-acetyltransferase [Nocardiopsis eucommiae]
MTVEEKPVSPKKARLSLSDVHDEFAHDPAQPTMADVDEWERTEARKAAPQWRVRPAVDDDCEAIIALDDETEGFFETSRDYIRGLPEDYEVWVAEDEGGRIVGWLEGRPDAGLTEELRHPEHRRPYAYIPQMLVSPRTRRQGIGQGLVRAFVEHAHSRGCTWIALRAKTGYDDDAERLGFFDRCGFQRMPEEPYAGGMGAPLKDVAAALETKV